MGARPGAVVLCAAEQNVALVIVVDGQILPDQLVDARFERVVFFERTLQGAVAALDRYPAGAR